MIKKLLLLLVFSCFLWAENTVNQDVVDKKDKAEVKKIEQKIINEKYDIPTTYKIKDVEDFYEHFFFYKKSLDNKIKFILPVGIGDCKITNEVTKDDVIEILKGF